MSQDFLANVEQDESFNFDSLVEQDEQVEETPGDSPTQNDQADTPPSQEGENESSDSGENSVDTPEDGQDSEDTPGEDNVPFHKHPRWQEMQNELRSKNEIIEQLKNDVGSVKDGVDSIQKEFKASAQEQVPSEFIDLYGLDPNAPNTQLAWKKFQALFPSQSREEIKQELKQEFIAEQQKHDQEQARIIEWSRSEMQKLKDEGKTFDENKLLKVIEKYSPVNEAGHTDFKKAYEIYELQEGARREKKERVVKAKKQIAARSSQGSSTEAEKPAFVTPEDLEGKDWQDFINKS